MIDPARTAHLHQFIYSFPAIIALILGHSARQFFDAAFFHCNGYLGAVAATGTACEKLCSCQAVSWSGTGSIKIQVASI
ncbi:MAG: hypothetical protein IID18_07045 [Nitrospinae bacterium]|nr:hypothetical protein [Nitrospinota bacterium]